jgi:hypothetical protein
MTFHIGWRHIIALILAGSVVAFAGSIKSWGNGEVITASDLNANFSHIHNAAEGATITASRLASNSVTTSKITDSAVTSAKIANETIVSADIFNGTIVDADVSASAAIAHSKLATPALVPKAYWVDYDACGAGACTANDSTGVTSVTGDGSGLYTVVIPDRGNANYLLMVTQNGAGKCYPYLPISATGFQIECRDSGGTLANSSISFIIMDNL